MISFESTTLANEEQPENTLLPKDSTLCGMMIPVRLLQFENALLSIVFSPSAMTTSVRPEQFEKALFPIVTVVAGIEMVCKLEHP